MSVLTPAGFRGAVLTAALVLAPPPTAWASAQAPVVPATAEYELKAAFLYNFTRFVEWPAEAFASASAPITIGILGDDPFGRSLDDMVANELVHGRKLTVRRYTSAEEIGPCQILFVCPGEMEHWEPIASRLGKRAILTVADGSVFTDRSGMIGFEMVNHHLRLRVNLAAARAAKLVISSQLLRQAKIVGPEANP